MKKYFLSLYGAWDNFWFGSNTHSHLLNLSLFRISFYAVFLFFYTSRAADVTLFYAQDGLLPSSYAKTLPLFEYRFSILNWISDLTIIHGMHTLLLVFLFTSCVGLFTRFSNIAAFILHLMFVNRNMTVMFGVDMIGGFFLFYLCFTQNNAFYSIDNLLFKRKASQHISGPVSFLFYRLMQIQLCVVYAYSGLEKLKGTRWWSGAALWDVHSMGNMQRWDLSFMAHFPFLFAAGSYVVLFWEIYFPVLVWNKKLKNPLLFFGFIMHVGIFLFMNLPSFGAMMIAIYVLFLGEKDIQWGIQKAKNLIRLAKPTHS